MHFLCSANKNICLSWIHDEYLDDDDDEDLYYNMLYYSFVIWNLKKLNK